MSSGGQVLGGVVGAVTGFFLGGGPTGALYGAQIGMMAGGYLDPPKGPTVEGPRLNDLSVQTSTYGAVIPRVYGTVTVNGNLFWLENNALKETVTKNKSGGKGGGGKTTTRTYSYSATFAVGLCKGPIAGVRRIWVGPDLVYDAGSSDLSTITASNAAASGFRIYLGTDTQSADARMQATLGVANTPAWRGLAYLVFYDLALARYGNSLMGAQVRCEMITSGTVFTRDFPADTSALTPSRWYDIATNGTVAVIVGITNNPTHSNIADFRYSYDGIDWQITWLPAVDIGDWLMVCWDGTYFIALGAYNRIVRSLDGITWSSLPNTAWGFGYLKSDGAGTVMQCSAGGLLELKVSTDHGMTWVTKTLPASFGYGFGFSSAGIVGLHSDTETYFSSDHGDTWTAGTLPGSGGPGICYGGGYWVVAGNSAAFRSSDGVNWTASTTNPAGSNYRYCIAYDGSRYFRPQANGYHVCYSPDALVWTEEFMSAASPHQTKEIAVMNGAFITTSEGYDSVTHCFIVGSGISSADYPLSSIVSSECLQSGLLTGGDIDVTALTSSVRGYRIGSISAIRAALEPLQAAWPFDVVQHGYVIRFVARGGASVVTIPAADLDARGAGQQPGVQITTSREMDSQLPRRVTVQHLDYDREYNTGTQYAERLNTAAINARVLDLPIVLTATEATGKAEVLLYLYWLERYDVSVTLPPTYNQLEPGDVVTLVTPEGNVSLRLTAVNYTSDGRLECRAKYASAAIYTPTAVGSVSAVSGPSTIVRVGASVYVLLDVPMINSAQSGPSFLAAMTGALAGWNGGVLMQSSDAGSTWASLQDFGPPGSSMGTCSNSIGVVESRLIDSASLLNVTLTQGALYSVTQLALLGGANHFAYGADGRWEIIAAQTCTLVSGTNYVLQNLLRGRFGSEWAMGLHTSGDTIVLLDTTDVAAITMSAGTIGLSYLYRGVTVDRDISTDSNRAFTYAGVNLKPLSPIALTGNRDAANDWALTWIRRTRDGGEWRDYVDASLGEATESYAIDVYADGSYATVKRTLTASSPSCAYTSANQVSDFGANQATLYLKLYQISATVGRGYPLTTSITR